MYCSNCGQELAPEAKFCSNCGAPVESGASGASSPNDSSPSGSDRDWSGYGSSGGSSSSRDTSGASFPPPPPPTSSGSHTAGSFSDRKPDWELERDRLRDSADDEWSMSSLGPPQRPRRRTWLWVLLGMIGLVVIACCGFMGWLAFTDSGMEWAENVIATSEAFVATEEAEAATPVP